MRASTPLAFLLILLITPISLSDSHTDANRYSYTDPHSDTYTYPQLNTNPYAYGDTYT